MQSGIFWGYVGLIEGLVARIKAEFGEPMTVIATGGLAPLFAGATAGHRRTSIPTSRSRGLVEIYRRNRSNDALMTAPGTTSCCSCRWAAPARSA